MSEQQDRVTERTPEYDPPGNGEQPSTDFLIGRLLEYRRATGKQDGFHVTATVKPHEVEDYGLAWDMRVNVSPAEFAAGETWNRVYEVRTDAYLAFDWYVNKLGLQEQQMLPDNAPDHVIERRVEVLQGTDSELLSEPDSDAE